jgi:hypothetical protein
VIVIEKSKYTLLADVELEAKDSKRRRKLTTDEIGIFVGGDPNRDGEATTTLDGVDYSISWSDVATKMRPWSEQAAMSYSSRPKR